MSPYNSQTNRAANLPVIIVTGASGFIGRHFLEAFKYEFYIHAIARRAQKAVGVERHDNINWIRLDIGDEEMVKEVFEGIVRDGGADFILHLAGFYDFTNTDNPEYERTNVKGTEFILKYAKLLNLKRFIFASSLTVTEFDKNDIVITEKSIPDANFPYARSKRKGENLIQEHCKDFPCAILRCAAIFSDWCEYGPLYILLSKWLSDSWDSNILPGKGEAALPYMHTKNLNSLIYLIIKQTSRLPRCGIYIASHDGCTAQKDLHNLALRYNFGRPDKLRFIPKWLAMLGVIGLNLLGKLKGKKPFIRPWMIIYTDKKMQIDASQTRKTVNWRPVERFQLQRRLLFLIENRKSNQYEWDRKNELALHEGSTIRPNLLIYESMVNFEQDVIREVLNDIFKPENEERFKNYIKLDNSEINYRFKNLYKMLKTAVVLGDRLHILSYARSLAVEHFKENFEVNEVINAISLMGDLIVNRLKKQESLKDIHLRIHDEILITVQLIIDELEDSYERLSGVA